MSGGFRGCLECVFVADTALVEVRSVRVYAPAHSIMRSHARAASSLRSNVPKCVFWPLCGGAS